MRWPWERKNISLNTLIERLEATFQTTSGETVTPETAMQSPTVHAIVTAVSRRIAISPIQVFRETTTGGRTRRQMQPEHRAATILARPNPWQPVANYWFDATSSFLRYGFYAAHKTRAGNKGGVRFLIPLRGDTVTVEMLDNFRLRFTHQQKDGKPQRYDAKDIHYARGPTLDFYTPVSPVMQVREAIALELAAERFGSAFFGNNALPGLIFKPGEEFKGFKTDEEQNQFVERLKTAFTGRKRFNSMLLPKGIEPHEVRVDNDKAQFIETRKLMRNVIAGAFGVPPHLVGDLERATFNNVEQQDRDFTNNVVLPVARAFEDALEFDLLTPADRADGIRIRFDLDAVQRADFKTRQEAMALKRQWGVASANDWREMDGENPIATDGGGEDYLVPMNYRDMAEEPVAPEPAPEPAGAAVENGD